MMMLVITTFISDIVIYVSSLAIWEVLRVSKKTSLRVHHSIIKEPLLTTASMHVMKIDNRQPWM